MEVIQRIEHRREVILRRTRFLLKQAEDLAEKLEGFLIALANLDDFIRIIRDINQNGQLDNNDVGQIGRAHV